MPAAYEESTMALLSQYPIDEKFAANQNELVNSNICPSAAGRCCRASRGQQRNAFVKVGMVALVVSILTLLSFLAAAILCPGAVPGVAKRQNTGNQGDNKNAFT